MIRVLLCHTRMAMNNFLNDPYLDSMNFLNEACIKHPDAISFGSGRPVEKFFHLEDAVKGVKRYAEIRGIDPNYLGQYNMTKGIINDYVAKLIKNDEGIDISPDDIIITDGAQEGMAILIDTLFSKNDVLIVTDPSYIGFIGYAKIAGIDIRVVKRSDTGIDFNDLQRVIDEVIKEGKNIAAMYEVPDFQNPTGISLPLEERKTLIELADKYDFYVIEDSPYGYYCYESEKIPSMKSLDTKKRVIYLGSTAKTVFPALRLGYLLIDQEVKVNGKTVKLAEECKKVKSFITVNTSSVVQAVFGAILYDNDFSLKQYCADKVSYCKQNRDVLAEIIEKEFDFCSNWSKPAGGYFTTVKIPFDPTNELVTEAIEKYGVIVCPMSMFCMNPENGKNMIRLSFSHMTPDQIKTGMKRMKDWIIDVSNR